MLLSGNVQRAVDYIILQIVYQMYLCATEMGPLLFHEIHEEEDSEH